MAKDDSVRLRHMMDSAMEAVELIHGKSRADLDTNRVLSLALVRLLEIVGEAASRVTIPTRLKYPDIPGLKSSASAIGSFMATIQLIWTFSGKS